jgi:hypothetical protein
MSDEMDVSGIWCCLKMVLTEDNDISYSTVDRVAFDRLSNNFDEVRERRSIRFRLVARHERNVIGTVSYF